MRTIHNLPRSPFRLYGLRHNPFGELTRGQRAELAIVELAPWLEFLRDERSVLQIIGPCGHGKTTHLLALELALERSAYVYFPEDGTQPPLPAIRPLLVDEAQRLKFWRKQQLFRGAGPLVLGTHVDLSSRARRAGFKIETIDVGLPKSPELIHRMLCARIEAARLAPQCLRELQQENPACAERYHVDISLARVVALQQRFGSNTRSIEHFLYQDLQRCVQERVPWPLAT